MMVVLLMGCESLKTKNYSPPQYISLKKQDLDSFIGKNVLEAQKVFGYALYPMICLAIGRFTLGVWEVR